MASMYTGFAEQNLTSEFQNNWVKKYSERHRFHRVLQLSAGIKMPRKVRIYQRSEHFVLQWWDRQFKKTLSTRVDGDLIEAISKAREIDENLLNFRRSGKCNARINQVQLLAQYQAHLERRSNSGEISLTTVNRYRSALSHYANFVKQPHILARYEKAIGIDHAFALEFRTYLKNLWVSPNGHPAASRKRLESLTYVMNTARGLFAWALSDQSGPLLPPQFTNPFAVRFRDTDETSSDLFGDPDISLAMAADFVRACDAWQLPLFCMYIFYGLRAAEPCWLFAESISYDWLRVECDRQLGYTTKGRRDKRLPMIEPVRRALAIAACPRSEGLLFQRRPSAIRRQRDQVLTRSREEMRTSYSNRIKERKTTSAAEAIKLRGEIHWQSGGLNYDLINKEFRQIHDRLGWTKSATLKDFRHLFSTCMGNAGIPDYYRKYLMGQSQGKAAIVQYTHLNQLKEHFQKAIHEQMGPILQALNQRLDELENTTDDAGHHQSTK